MLGLSAPVMAQQGSGLDFRLPPADDGRDSNVQGPSDNGLPPVSPRETVVPKAPPLAPKIVPPTPKVTQPTPPTPQSQPKSGAVTPVQQPAPAPKAAAPKAAEPVEKAPAPQQTPPVQPSGGLMDTDVITPPSQDPLPLPLPEVTTSEDSIAETDAATDDAATTQMEDAAPAEESGDMPWWAWALAAALGLGAGLLYWRRQGQGDDGDHAEEPVVAAARPAAPVPNPAPVPQPAPAPTPAPAVSPVANPEQPNVAPASPVTRPLTPPPSPEAAMGYVQAKPLVRRAAAEVRADVSMDVAVRSIRVEQDHVAVGFLLTLSNRGSLAATGLMVRIALGQGAAMNEAVLGRFFDGAGGSVLRDDIDLPAGRSEQLSSEVKLPRSAIDPLMMAGQPMLVPVLAADVTYHWDGPGEAFGQIASAYVLGRASVGGSEKLSPVSLAHTPVAVDRPAARMTAMGRRQ